MSETNTFFYSVIKQCKNTGVALYITKIYSDKSLVGSQMFLSTSTCVKQIPKFSVVTWTAVTFLYIVNINNLDMDGCMLRIHLVFI